MTGKNSENKTAADDPLSFASTRTASRTGLKCGSWVLAAISLLVFAHEGVSGDVISPGGGVPPIAAKPAARSCLTDRQVDAIAGADVAEGKPGPRELGELFAEDAWDGLNKASKGALAPGIQAKTEEENSEVRAHITQFYQDYRRLAAAGKLTPADTGLYAKTNIGPRLDKIYINELNWLGKKPDRSRMAGQVYAYIALVEIARQEGEKNAMNGESLMAAQNGLKSESKNKDYPPLSQEEYQKRSLAVFKYDFEHSPQYERAEALKKAVASRMIEREAAEKANEECERAQRKPVDEATVTLRRDHNSGSALVQDAIRQSEQDERDRPAREARARSEQARAQAEEAARLTSEQRAATERAHKQDDGIGLGDVIRALGGAAEAYAKSKAGGSSTGRSGDCGPGLVNDMGRCVPRTVCTSGSTYDAKACSCMLNPRGAGCR